MGNTDDALKQWRKR